MKQKHIGVGLMSKTIVMTMIIMIMMLFSSTASLSSDDNIGVENKQHKYGTSIIQQHDMDFYEPTVRTSIDKLLKHNDNEQQVDNHIDDTMIMSKDVAVFHHHHRMTQTCVNTEIDIRNAVNSANNRSSSTPTIMNICIKNITMTNRIDIVNKSIVFNCINNNISNPFDEMCTLNAQRRSRHFTIINSIVLFKQLIFMNGETKGSFDDGNGGSLYINDTSTVDIINCQFFSNEVNFGGGAIYMEDSISTMINVTMSNNKCGFWGGAIILFYNCNVTMINNIITNNVADITGGAVFSRSSNLNISNSILSNNTANNIGGAIFCNEVNLVITNTSLTSNNAGQEGGAINSARSTLIVTKSTLSDNTANVNGTCLYSFDDDITITDSVAYNNNPKSLCEIYISQYSDSEESRIEISGEILLQSQACHVFPKQPSYAPSFKPSRVPSKRPSAKPSVKPSLAPSRAPSKRPSPMPSVKPSKKPSSAPLKRPSAQPSVKPSKKPSSAPLKRPSAKPSVEPSFKPSRKPSSRDRCVDNENELRLAISDAGASRIDVCSSYIQIDASLPNSMGIQGIHIKNKLLSIYCMASEMCILDAQHLSRMFAVLNSTLHFQDFMFINSDASQDSLYKSGGAFYIKDSTIKMLNCGFVNNVAANFGGGMVVLKSNLTIYGSDNAISFTRIEGNRATTNGGFISSDSSNIEIYNHNFLYNIALYGGVFNIKNSILTIISNDSDTANKIHHNAATVDGGFICAYSNSIIEIDNYIFLNNTATNGAGGDAFLVQDSALTLKVRDDLTIPTTFEIEKNNVNIL